MCLKYAYYTDMTDMTLLSIAKSAAICKYIISKLYVGKDILVLNLEYSMQIDYQCIAYGLFKLND